MYNVIGMYKIRQGFTLMELMISIGLMAILSAGVISLIGPQPKRSARDNKRMADLQSIASALEMYRNDCSGYPGATGTLSPAYMAVIPKDPKDSSAYTYTPATSISVTCNGAAVTVYKTFSVCSNKIETPGATNPYCVTNP